MKALSKSCRGIGILALGPVLLFAEPTLMAQLRPPATQPIRRAVPGPTNTPAVSATRMVFAPTFTSTVPSPFRLAPGGANQFTIKGKALDFVKSVTLVNSRTPVWSFLATIRSRTPTNITAIVNFPKYVTTDTYQIWATIKKGAVGTEFIDTGLIAQMEENKPSSVWTEFNPLLHGFSFVNDGWGRICFRLSGGALEYDESSSLCDSDWGLCGGMSLVAGERFRSSVKGTHDLSQAAAKPDAVNGQFRTLDGSTVKKFFEWIYAPDEGHMLNPSHSVGYRMQQDWNGLIKPPLDAHKPVVLGLIFDKMAEAIPQLNPLNAKLVTKQHQVLGIGYSRIGADTVVITAYDPNIPNDILILTFAGSKTGVAQALDSGRALPSGRRHVRGVMFVRNVP